MAALNSPDYIWLWALVLAAALFYPVRQLLWVVQVRCAERDGKPDEGRRMAIKRRATVTAILLCGAFSVLYTLHLFSKQA